MKALQDAVDRCQGGGIYVTALDKDDVKAALARIAELEAALRNLVQHDDAMSGPRAHPHGCDCAGTPDGLHSCYTLRQAFVNAKAVLTN